MCVVWARACVQCVCVCVEAVVRLVVVVEAGVVQPARRAAVELARVCEAGDFEKGKISG